ncbi:MAG: hypothetical protein RL009_1246 [Actinomycetota bacterium]
MPTKPAGTLYRGKTGMWSWVLHRITGVRVSPEAYNAVINTYKTPLIGLAELGLVAALLFHGLNGVRVMLIDFWRKGSKYQNVMFWIVIALAFILFLGFAPRHLMHVFG